MARGYLPPANDEEKLFFRRVKELAYAAQSSGMPRHTAFLSDRQQVLARAALSSAGCADYHFDGGYPEAERAILCLHGDAPKTGAPQFGCLLVEATERHNALTHRDYLGAFLSLGIKRECIGDILPCSAGAYVFLLDTVVPLLCEELCRVGRCAVRVRRAQAQELPAQTQRPLRKASIASLRQCCTSAGPTRRALSRAALWRSTMFSQNRCTQRFTRTICSAFADLENII